MMPLSNQIELRHLRYFLAVAEELHFRKAAEKLFISQPGLSRQIKFLEEELGVQLFERHNRKVELTSRGTYLRREISALFKDLDTVLSHAQQLEKGLQGNLRLGYIGSAMRDVIPTFLLSVRQAFPQIRFDLKELDNQHQIEDILHRELDLGFVRVDRVPRGLEMHPVQEDTFSLVLPKDHPIHSQNFVSLSQLQTEPFILFDPSYSTSYYEKVMQIFDHSGFSPKISHKTVHAYTIYRLVENHFGVSIVPTCLQKGYDMNIQFIELTHIEQRTTLQVIWNKKNQNPILQHVLDLVKRDKG